MTGEQKANLALAGVLLVAIAMNVWATVQTNQVRAQISNLFCIEAPALPAN